MLNFATELISLRDKYLAAGISKKNYLLGIFYLFRRRHISFISTVFHPKIPHAPFVQ